MSWAYLSLDIGRKDKDKLCRNVKLLHDLPGELCNFLSAEWKINFVLQNTRSLSYLYI